MQCLKIKFQLKKKENKSMGCMGSIVEGRGYISAQLQSFTLQDQVSGKKSFPCCEELPSDVPLRWHGAVLHGSGVLLAHPPCWIASVFQSEKGGCFSGLAPCAFMGATAPVLWPPDAEKELVPDGKDLSAGKDRGQEKWAMRRMVGWHHQSIDRAMNWNSEGQGSLAVLAV